MWPPPQPCSKAFPTVYRVDEEQSRAISRNLTAFLAANLEKGQQAQVAIHRESESVVVFVNGEPILTCSFNDLRAGPGGSIN